MNITEFYSNIIEKEKESFNFGKKSLKAAVRSVVARNDPKCIKKSQSSQKSTIYNEPSNRCAYLYKYGTINTGLVTKYFRKLAFKKEVKNKMYSNKRVCCLGGGPGTDVVGIFKALAVNPAFNARITDVSVLDICSGWENMFNNTISGLLEGKLKDVPETFINPKTFSHQFIEVDILDSLPCDVMEIISKADIVCMSRFVSAILGDARSSNALKVLGNSIKLGALVLYIDILNEEVFGLTEDLSQDTGLETVLNPLHEMFTRYCAPKKEVYGYFPEFKAEFSIVGWHKTSITTNMNTIFDGWYSTNNSDTESEESSTALEVYDSEDNSNGWKVMDSEGNGTSLDVFDSEDNSDALEVLDSEYNGDALEVLNSEYNSDALEVPNSEGNGDALEVLDSEYNGDALEVPDSEDNGDSLEMLNSEVNDDILEVPNSEDSHDVLDVHDSKNKESSNKHCLVDSCTQTESNIFTYTVSSEKEDILALMKAVSNLLNVVERWKQKHTFKKCCCCH